jgi:hypothetical protein
VGWAIFHWFELGTLALLCLNLRFVSSVLKALRETNRWLAFLTRVQCDETHGPRNPTEGRPNPPVDTSLTCPRVGLTGLAIHDPAGPKPSGERRRVMSPNPVPLLSPKSGRPPCPRRVSTTPASLALIVYFAQSMCQSFPLFTEARRTRQTIAKLMFPVSEALAVLPVLPIVALVPPRLRRNSRDLWDRDLNVGLPRV